MSGASAGPGASGTDRASVQVREAAPAAVYERELDASVERIWENVLDWEHLPFLHPQAFSSVRMDSESRDHWSGVVGLPGTPEPIEIDVRLDRSALRYTTRTVAGVGAGTAIVTSLFPRSDRATGIRVDFHLPWAPPEAAAHIGEVYRGLYVQLWDQDEDMMRERQRVLDDGMRERQRVLDDWQRERQRVLDDGQRERSEGSRSVSLGRVRELASRLPLDVDLAGRRFRVVSIDGRLHAYDVRCPHLGGPLPAPHRGSCEVVCPWHGYRFDIRANESSDGRSLRMGRPALVEVSACDGEVRLHLP